MENGITSINSRKHHATSMLLLHFVCYILYLVIKSNIYVAKITFSFETHSCGAGLAPSPFSLNPVIKRMCWTLGSAAAWLACATSLTATDTAHRLEIATKQNKSRPDATLLSRYLGAACMPCYNSGIDLLRLRRVAHPTVG